MSKLREILFCDVGEWFKSLLFPFASIFFKPAYPRRAKRLSPGSYVSLLHELQLNIRCNLPLPEALCQSSKPSKIFLTSTAALLIALLSIAAFFLIFFFCSTVIFFLISLLLFLSLPPILSHRYAPYQLYLKRLLLLWFILWLLNIVGLFLKGFELELDFEVGRWAAYSGIIFVALGIFFYVLLFFNYIALSINIITPGLGREAILRPIASEIEKGEALSAALRKYLRNVTPFHYSVIKTGEESGRLDKSLGLIIEYEKAFVQASFRKLFSLCAYPLTLLVFILIIGLFIITTIAPKYAEFFAAKGIELPRVTKIFLSISQFDFSIPLSAEMNIYLGIVFTVLFLILLWIVIINFFRYFPTYVHFMPFVRRPHRRNISAKIFILLGVALQAGLPIEQALKNLSNIFRRDLVAKYQLRKIGRRILNGEKISRVLGEAPIISPDARALVKLSEDANLLEQELLNIAQEQINSAAYEVARLGTYTAPLFHLLLVLFVFFIIFSVYFPLFQLPVSYGR